ncbi:MAG: hypothetical protein ACU841_01830 [Gammaproteobacteria bacterium]
MNSTTKKTIAVAMLLLLSACAHYRQPVYDRYAGPYPAYGSGYVIQEKNYYPHRYDNYYSAYGNYGHDAVDRHHHHDDGYRKSPWNKGQGRAKPQPGHWDRHDNRKNRPSAFRDRDRKPPYRQYHDAKNGNGKTNRLHFVDRNPYPHKPDERNKPKNRRQFEEKTHILGYR